MVREGTDGGLFIVPTIKLQDLDNLDGYTSREELESMTGETDFDDVEFNPLRNYRDELFDRPCSISFGFYDRNKDLTPQPNSRPTLNSKNLQNSIIYFDSLDPNIEWDGEGQVTDIQHRNVFDMGFVKDNMFSPDPVVSTEIEDEHVRYLFNDLAREAGKNIASGKVNLDDLKALNLRNNGLRLKNSTLTDFTHERDSAGLMVMSMLLTEPATEMMAKHLKDMASNSRLQFKDILPSIYPSLKEEFHKHSTLGKEEDWNHDDYQMLATRTLMSTLVHGIGERQFLPKFLDSLRLVKPESVDEFLGWDLSKTDDPVTRKGRDRLTSKLLRALPPSSNYHRQIVQNYFKDAC